MKLQNEKQMSKSSFTIRKTKKVTKKYQKRNIKIGQKNCYIGKKYVDYTSVWTLQVIHSDARDLCTINQ